MKQAQPANTHGLLLLTDLENIELQIVRFIRAPQYRMVGRLRAEFNLAEALMNAASRLRYGFGEQLLRHKM